MVQLLAEHLRALNDASVVEAVVEKISECAYLGRHITCAGRFLEKLGDAIPDGSIARWLERLKPSRCLPCTTLAEDWAAQPALKATAVLLEGASATEGGQSSMSFFDIDSGAVMGLLAIGFTMFWNRPPPCSTETDVDTLPTQFYRT